VSTTIERALARASRARARDSSMDQRRIARRLVRLMSCLACDRSDSTQPRGRRAGKGENR
jgi:hypothetical protein